MRLYINDKSKHPAQQKLEEQYSPVKLIGIGAFLVAFSVIAAVITVYTVPSNLAALMRLAEGNEVVNISFPVYIIVCGFFLFPYILLLGYSMGVHRRTVVLEELTLPFRRGFIFLSKAAKICLYIVTPICFVLSFVFIQWHDYHWCPQDEATIWDSQWAIDPLLCQ